MYFHRTLLATVIPLLVVPICAAPAVGAELVPAPATIIGTSLQAKIHHSSVHAYPHQQFRRKQHMSWQDAKEILKDTWNVVKDIVPCAEDAVGQISGVLDDLSGIYEFLGIFMPKRDVQSGVESANGSTAPVPTGNDNNTQDVPPSMEAKFVSIHHHALHLHHHKSGEGDHKDSHHGSGTWNSTSSHEPGSHGHSFGGFLGGFGKKLDIVGDVIDLISQIQAIPQTANECKSDWNNVESDAGKLKVKFEAMEKNS